jgi:pyruvate kinase
MIYDIIATLGPASKTEDIWRSLIRAGVTGFRLNSSHLSIDELNIWLVTLQFFIEKEFPHIPIILDLQGSKWRLGIFEEVDLLENEVYNLKLADSSENSKEIPVPHDDFFKAAHSSEPLILVNDAKIRLLIEEVSATHIITKVIQGGKISSKKGITFQDSAYRKETLTEKDKIILNQTNSVKNIRYAISYVRDSEEFKNYRENIGKDYYLISKVERLQALLSAKMMINDANEIWICRGDLGAEIGFLSLAREVFLFSKNLKDFPLRTLLAGQVLEHMTKDPNPTRSEICHLYESLQKGFAGFVLSDETAIGKFPVESVRTSALFR